MPFGKQHTEQQTNNSAGFKDLYLLWGMYRTHHAIQKMNM